MSMENNFSKSENLEYVGIRIKPEKSFLSKEADE